MHKNQPLQQRELSAQKPVIRTGKATLPPAWRPSVDSVVEQLAAAADHGQLVLFAEASVALKALLAAEQLRILVHSGGVWRRWDRLDAADGLRGCDDDVPPNAATWDSVMQVPFGLFVPVRTGSVALIVSGIGATDREADPLIRTAATILRLALASCEGTHGNPDKLEAIHAFQRVANRILKSQDLQEILLLITHETKTRLSADICGVMLRENDELVMQRCVGNLSANTAALRMREGQGVGGRVLETLEPCFVEDYLRSNIISSDFFDLARIERVRSALAAPLIAQGQVIGVLEVWRRRPSTFTPQHNAELVTLASLASIAIESVRLSQARERMVEQLADANQALRTRYEIIQQTAALQDDLTRALLEGQDLSGIAACANLHLGARVLVLDAQLKLEAANPSDGCDAELHQKIRAVIDQPRRMDPRLTVEKCAPHAIAFQPIIAGADHFGWIVVIDGNEQAESLRLSVAQVAVTAALLHLKKRAAARARSDRLASVLWDLLEAPDAVRRMAIERARELGLTFVSHHRVICCVVHGLEPAAGATSLPPAESERRQRLVNESVAVVQDASPVVRLFALRGETLGILCAERDGDGLKRFGDLLARQLSQALPTVCVSVGISTAITDPIAACTAYREARIAAAVACQSGKVGVVSYSDVGVAGLLMGARDDKDFRGFVLNTLGPVLDEKDAQRDVLLKTLRTFFLANCSRQTAARQLRIHQKTMCYRLEKFSRLTGLDLARHEDRVLTDLALRMHDIVE